MKALKLISLFAVVLGATIVVFYFGGTQPKNDSQLYDDDVIRDYYSKFDEAWNRETDWNEKTFTSHHETIERLGKEHSVENLRNLNTQRATEMICKKVKEEWKKTNCQEAKVKRYIQALNFVEEKDKKASTDNNTKLVRRIYKVYKNALEFTRGEIHLNPEFANSSWNSFEQYKKKKLDTRVAILRNNDYQEYLSSITSIRNGLNAVEGKLAAARQKFYSDLANKIIQHYQNLERTDNNLRHLSQIREQYEKEFQSNSQLSDFVRAFRQDVRDQNGKRLIENEE